MASLVVSYPRHEGARFDAAYYIDKHVPLVDQSWRDCGLTGAEVLMPADETQPFAAMVVLHFRDSAAIDTALTSPGAPVVMGDVPNFTDIQPTVYRTA